MLISMRERYSLRRARTLLKALIIKTHIYSRLLRLPCKEIGFCCVLCSSHTLSQSCALSLTTCTHKDKFHPISDWSLIFKITNKMRCPTLSPSTIQWTSRSPNKTTTVFKPCRISGPKSWTPPCWRSWRTRRKETLNFRRLPTVLMEPKSLNHKRSSCRYSRRKSMIRTQ